VPGQACERNSTATPPLLEQEDAWSFVVFFLNLLRDDSAHILEGEELAANSRQTDAATVATAAAAPTARPQVFDVGSTNDFPSLGAPAAASKLTVTSQKRRIKPTKLSDGDRPAVGNITAVADSSSVVASATAAESANSSRSVFSYSNAVAAAHVPLPPPPAPRAANTMAAVAARAGTRRTAEYLMGGGIKGSSTSTTGFGSAKLSVSTAGAFSAPTVASVQPRTLTVQRGAVLSAQTVISDAPQALVSAVVSTAKEHSGSTDKAETVQADADADAVCAHKRAEMMAALASIYAHIILCKVHSPLAYCSIFIASSSTTCCCNVSNCDRCVMQLCNTLNRIRADCDLIALICYQNIFQLTDHAPI
jgi:hypothetical protein